MSVEKVNYPTRVTTDPDTTKRKSQHEWHKWVVKWGGGGTIYNMEPGNTSETKFTNSGTSTTHHRDGGLQQTIVGNATTYAKSGMTFTCDENMDVKVTGHGNLQVQGGVHIAVTGDANIVTTGSVAIGSTGHIGVYAAGNMSIGAGGNMNIKAGGKLSIDAAETATMTSTGDMTLATKSAMHRASSGEMTDTASAVHHNKPGSTSGSTHTTTNQTYTKPSSEFA